MKYLSICSGIEAASVAWEPLGFTPIAFSEIEAFPSAVLKHRYPNVPNAGDFTAIQGKEYGKFDILVGGTPCQSFSIAGKRGGLSDERGNLALEYIKLAYRSRPEFIVWENVPGVFSSSKGNDFRCFLHGLTGVDVPVPQKGWKNSGLIVGMDGHYSIAWRVLDAQFAGVPQHRRRVFVVGHLGDWRRAAAVLFERESLLWNPAPSREVGQDVAGTITSGFGDRGVDADQICNGNYAIRGVGIGGSEVGFALRSNPSHSGDKGDGGVNCNLAIYCQGFTNRGIAVDEAETLRAGSHGALPMVAYNSHNNSSVRIRRLTPRECERLQGFQDDYTLIPVKGKLTADGPRYKALGNSMAVPVMRWIGERIKKFSTQHVD